MLHCNDIARLIANTADNMSKLDIQRELQRISKRLDVMRNHEGDLGTVMTGFGLLGYQREYELRVSEYWGMRVS